MNVMTTKEIIIGIAMITVTLGVVFAFFLKEWERNKENKNTKQGQDITKNPDKE